MPNCPIEVLVVNNGCQLPESVSTLFNSDQMHVRTVDCLSDVEDGVLSKGLDAALILNTSSRDDLRAAITSQADRLAERLGSERAGVIMVTPDYDGRSDGSSLLDMVGPQTSSDELVGRLSTLARYRPLIQRLEHELNNMHRLGKQLNHHFTEVDQEMRLASRLQQDFLPKEMPTVGGIQVATIFRPASWVSGDIYDVSRVDEENVGLYIADAVGHGMAAGLLTMFIKRAIVPKRIDADSYEIMPPGEVLARLNETLRSQNLPNCQFVTACYCLYNVATKELHVSRGGHPYPIRIGVDGSLTEIRSTGGLLGVFPDEEFETVSTRLEPGEKLLIYSDGIELAFVEDRNAPGGEAQFEKGFASVAKLPPKQFVQHLIELLDAEEGSLNPHDDVTVIVMETPR